MSLAAVWRELQAECIAVPPCDIKYLPRGFALHFRCQHPEARGLRVDVMSVIRGVDNFDANVGAPRNGSRTMTER